jgi:type IV secretory pathway VirB2 component (pilin)
MAELWRVVMVDTVDLLKHMVVVLLRRTADMVCQQEGLTLEVDTTMQTQAEEVVTGATATLVAIVDVEVVEDIEKTTSGIPALRTNTRIRLFIRI